MRAITVRDRATGLAGLSLTEEPYPHATENDVVVRVHAAGFTPGELDWPGTWTDRAGHDRTPSVPGHEVSGIVAELGYGTTGLTVGQRVFGLTDWTRNGSLAEYVAVEARNLAPLPADVDHTVAAALPISGLTAWQGLFDHGRLTAGQTVLIHGVAGGVGSIAVQLAREAGARVIGTGRAGDRDTALGLGVAAFLDLQADPVEDAGQVDVVFDVIGGDILDRSAALVRAGGMLVTIVSPPRSGPVTGRRSSSSSSRIVPGWRTWHSGSGTDGSARSSGPCGRSPRRPPRSRPPSAPPARRSSGSRKANSRLSRRCIGSAAFEQTTAFEQPITKA
ncbi:NADP-dependent oxidoreductase [Nonomuraea cavernae]|uniref:NADP-dependent oxidoreductase n=1 Tax=Nonomuraea cavernae TaxID=2045107 RepID=UPI0033D14EF2